MKPVLALVGRPNVGKSTLFNRLTKSRDAIVADFAGLTRDRHYGNGKQGRQEFIVIDTGGFEPDASAGIYKEMAKQTQQAVAEADIVIFVVDARGGLSAQDHDIAKYLRKIGKPCLLVANKAEGMLEGIQLTEFYELGLGEVIAISAAHGQGTRGLVELAFESLNLPDEPEETEEDPSVIKLAVAGRPNVGKSTLINTLAGRIIAKTGNEAGVTKSQQRIKLDNNVILTDTPGFLWPKLNPPSCGYRLAITAAIKDTVFDYADIAMFAADYFIKAYPERIKARYQITDLPETEIELLEMIARQRAFVRKGGLADLHKASEILVNEFRSGMLGRISLETPEMVSAEIVLAAEEAEQKAKEKAEREEERQARARRKYARKRQK